MKKSIYNLPEYYDVAFSWDNTKEIERFGRFFEKHADFSVKNILEPACGTGRFLVAFPAYGYKITGYDNNPEMVSYAREKIRMLGHENVAAVFFMDMRSAQMDKKYDSAFNSINSLGYLLTDEDILSHFKSTGRSIMPGGIYIIHIACAWDTLPAHEEEGWTIEKDGVSVRTVWDIEAEDKRKKLSYNTCKMYIDDHGTKTEIVDTHILRLWVYDDLKALISKSHAFKLEAIYNEKEEEIPLDSHINGEMGNLYYVLKATMKT